MPPVAPDMHLASSRGCLEGVWGDAPLSGRAWHTICRALAGCVSVPVTRALQVGLTAPAFEAGRQARVTLSCSKAAREGPPAS